MAAQSMSTSQAKKSMRTRNKKGTFAELLRIYITNLPFDVNLASRLCARCSIVTSNYIKRKSNVTLHLFVDFTGENKRNRGIKTTAMAYLEELVTTMTMDKGSCRGCQPSPSALTCHEANGC